MFAGARHRVGRCRPVVLGGGLGGRRDRAGRGSGRRDDMGVCAHICGPMGTNRIPARKEFPRVFEHDDAVAEQAPALLGAADYGPGSLTVQRSRVWTRWRVRAHSVPPGSVSGCGADHMLVCRPSTARDIVRCDDLSSHSLLLVANNQTGLDRSDTPARPVNIHAAGLCGTGGMPVSRWLSRSVSSRSASSVQRCTVGVAIALRRTMRSS